MLCLNVLFKVHVSKMSLDQEISGLKNTLELLGEGKNNLNQHFEIQIKEKLSALQKNLLECVEKENDLICELKIQEENFSTALKEYIEKKSKVT